VNSIASNIAGLTGKALNSGAFYLVYVHAAELFPTMTRNSFMSMGSFGGRMGSLVSAYIPFLGKFKSANYQIKFDSWTFELKVVKSNKLRLSLKLLFATIFANCSKVWLFTYAKNSAMTLVK